MRFEAADYVEAAQERLLNAKLLYEAAHNLPLLLRASQLRNLVTPSEDQQLYESVSLLSRRWKNDLRYTSNNRLRRRLKKNNLDRGIRGDFLKENCPMAIALAATILRNG